MVKKNPGGRYFDGYNFSANGTYSQKGEAKNVAKSLRDRGKKARVTKNSSHGWDVWSH